MTNSLSNKIAVVTGGSRGLGREMVLAFAKAGADVVIASRKIEACEAVAQRSRGARPPRAAVRGACRQVERQRRAGRCRLQALRPRRHPRQQCRHVAAGAVADRDERGAVRQGHRHQFQGTVPALLARRREDDGGRWRRDHQPVEHRVRSCRCRTPFPMAAPRRRSTSMTVALAKAFGAEGAGQLHLPRPVPHRCLHRVARRQGGAAAAWPQALRQSARRSSAPRSISRRDASSYVTGQVIRVDGGSW